jgi:hypothetical protein
MPPLSRITRSESPQGYAAQETLPSSDPAPKREPGQALAGNAFIRTPLPPFNATSDTLRQFNEGGKVPTRRVIPLPAQVAMGGDTTIIENTSVTSQSGGSTSGNVVSSAVSTATIDVGTMLPGDVAVLSLPVAKAAILMIVGSSDQCEVRIYGDAGTQAVDVARATDTAPAFEVTTGLTTDIVFDTDPMILPLQNRTFVNQDTPQTDTLYITVINSTDGAVTPSITITFLPLE